MGICSLSRYGIVTQLHVKMAFFYPLLPICLWPFWTDPENPRTSSVHINFKKKVKYSKERLEYPDISCLLSWTSLMDAPF
jgi:hypothetical protein